MDSFYIFQYHENLKEKHILSLVIFCSGESVNVDTLRDRLRDFFRSNAPPQKIYVIGGEYLKVQLIDIFIKNKDGLFDVIPNYLTKDEEINIWLFDESGTFVTVKEKQLDTTKSNNLLREGIYNIFQKHGGLIEAPSETYHYVFPSGKHSTRFIRAGNVLVNGAEIFFITLPLLKSLTSNVSHIYCDTSSINSLAFALVELKRRLNKHSAPAIVSFGSYEKFENFNFRDIKNSLILISASTSGRIVKRLVEKNPNIRTDNVFILFYLSNDLVNCKVICNLTSSESFAQGLKVERGFDNEVDCDLCAAGSYTVKISGDIFLLEKPKINTVTIVKADAPEWLSRFMQKFYTQKKLSLFRCYFGEDQIRTFEVFFKTDDLLRQLKKLQNNFFAKEEFLKKLTKTIAQYVPVHLRYIIHLEDEGSKMIAEQIHADCDNKKVKVFSSKQFVKAPDADLNESGAVLVVCSCLVTGHNLLYVNKYLRRFENMTKSFLVLFARMESDQHFEFIKKNIGQGEFGINTNNLVFVEKINCTAKSDHVNAIKTLSWSIESDVIRRMLTFAEASSEFQNSIKFLNSRLVVLEAASDIHSGGLIDEVFLRNPTGNKRLKINKNFAFFDFEGYHRTVTQADVYFTISAILNHLRTCPDLKKRKIVQEEQVRTLIDPDNFIRFDDGIIQASILRSASPEELNYKLSTKHSALMANTISKMIDNYSDSLTSEGLLEFLMALASKRMRLNEKHLAHILTKIDEAVENKVLKLFSAFIRAELLKKS
jgi:hypothetical protein